LRKGFKSIEIALVVGADPLDLGSKGASLRMPPTNSAFSPLYDASWLDRKAVGRCFLSSLREGAAWLRARRDGAQSQNSGCGPVYWLREAVVQQQFAGQRP
jgi:hypothetical protein